MSYTYDEPNGGVFTDPVSNVRYLLEDTSPKAPFSLADGEIEYELAQVDDVLSTAAANVAYKMARRYSVESVTSKSVGNLSISRDYSGTAARYMALARDLRSRGNVGAVAAGIFTAGSPKPQFRLGQFDFK